MFSDLLYTLFGKSLYWLKVHPTNPQCLMAVRKHVGLCLSLKTLLHLPPP